MSIGFPSCSPPKMQPSRTCMEVQVISSLVPLQRPWEGSKSCRSITGLPSCVPVSLWNANLCQILQIFRSITYISILSIVFLHFLSLMDDLIITCKGHPRELGKHAVVELIHYFIVDSMDCEVPWWSWLRIGDTWVSCMEENLQACFCGPSVGREKKVQTGDQTQDFPFSCRVLYHRAIWLVVGGITTLTLPLSRTLLIPQVVTLVVPLGG